MWVLPFQFVDVIAFQGFTILEQGFEFVQIEDEGSVKDDKSGFHAFGGLCVVDWFLGWRRCWVQAPIW